MTYEEAKLKAINKLENKGELLFLTEVGSRLYGTNSEHSDTDFRGIYIPNLNSIFSGNYDDQIYVNPQSKVKNTAEDCDFELWSIQKFIRLLAKNETNAIDLLFSKLNRLYMYNSSDFVIPYKRFFSKNISSFLGFALNQADRYGIKGTRIRNVIEFRDIIRDVPETSSLKLHDIWDTFEIDNFKYINFVELNDKKYLKVLEKNIPGDWKVVKFLSKLDDIISEFGERALRAKSGSDWKALSHAVRVLSETEEYLTNKFITFPLKERDLIKGIKEGYLTSREVSDEIEYRLAKVKLLSEKSELPENISDEIRDSTISEFIKDFYGIRENISKY